MKLLEVAPIVVSTAYHTVYISIPTVLESLFGKVTRRVCDQRLNRWSAALLDHAEIKLEVHGRENIDTSGATIVMSNHQSLYDIPVLFQVLPPSLRMVTKIELFSIPVWGRAMQAAGFIAIDRKHRERAIQSLKVARATLESGVSVWMAPEGTRSRDGLLLPFKKGGFVLAEEMNASILPISIHGTRDILPAKTWHLNRGASVKVTVHPRIRVDGLAPREELMERVRVAIQSGLN